jgi:hypothetical protein
MIKNLLSSGKYISVLGGGATNYINNYTGAQGIGNLRFNTAIQTMEVYDGNNWIQLYMGNATVGLNAEAESLLDWTRKKRDEELELEVLAQTNPTIRDLLDTIKQKQEQITIVKALIKHEVGESTLTNPYGAR